MTAGGQDYSTGARAQPRAYSWRRFGTQRLSRLVGGMTSILVGPGAYEVTMSSKHSVAHSNQATPEHSERLRWAAMLRETSLTLSTRTTFNVERNLTNSARES